MALIYPEESYIIRGVAFDIYKVFRNRHKEKIYQNAFYLSLKHKGLYTDYKLGFLINFGAVDGVEIIRRVYDLARTHSVPR